ncbi:hypothetical protein ACFX1R_036197 [Malus domestica]
MKAGVLERKQATEALFSLCWEKRSFTRSRGCDDIIPILLLHQDLQYAAVSFRSAPPHSLSLFFFSLCLVLLLLIPSSEGAPNPKHLSFLCSKESRAQIRGAEASHCRLERQVVGKAVAVF